MAIIVKHRRTENNYILLSINGELDQGKPSRFISELFNQEKSEASRSAAVCDLQGNIFLAYIDDLIVTEIDGKKLTEILPEITYDSVSQDNYSEETTEFDHDLEHDLEHDFDDDQELKDEDFNDEQNRVLESKSETSFADGEQYSPKKPQGLGSPLQDTSMESDLTEDEDHDDWI